MNETLVLVKFENSVTFYDSRTLGSKSYLDILLWQYLKEKPLIIINGFETKLWLFEDLGNFDALRSVNGFYEYIIRLSKFDEEQLNIVLNCPEFTYGSYFAPFVIFTNYNLTKNEIIKSLDNLTLNKNKNPFIQVHESIFIVSNGTGFTICNPAEGVNNFVAFVQNTLSGYGVQINIEE